MIQVMRLKTKTVISATAGTLIFCASLIILFFGPGFQMARANQGLEIGDLAKAQSIYDQLAARRPDAAQIRYNLGLCHYHRGEYENARSELEQALEGLKKAKSFGRRGKPDPFLAQVNYQLGNTVFELAAGKQPAEEAAALYREALGYYQQALRVDPRDVEAKYNYELVLQRLSPNQGASGQQTSQELQQSASQTEEYLQEATSEESPPVGNDW